MEAVISFTTKERFMSLNDWYSGGRWHGRQSAKKKYAKFFALLLEPYKNIRLDSFKIVMNYNNRYDCDNTITIIKLFVDSLKECGIIKNDNNKIFKSLEINYCSNMERDTVKLEVWRF